MQSVCYLTIITSAHPHSLILFVYRSPCARHLPLGATTTLPGDQDTRTRSNKTHFHVKCLKNVSFWMVLIGTVNASVGTGDLVKFVAFVGCFAWYVYSRSLHFLMFLRNVPIILWVL